MTGFAFRPAWQTTAGLIATAAEGSMVSTTVVADISATLVGAAGQTSFPAGAAAAQVTRVTVAGTAVGFTVSGQNILLDTPLSSRAVVVATLGQTPDIRLQNGQLPPGLSLNPSTGALSGSLSFIPGVTPATYTFTLRAKYQADSTLAYVRDRQFAVTVTQVAVLAVEWNNPALPPIYTDPETNITARRIAMLNLGAALTFQPEVIGSGDTPLSFTLTSMEGVTTSATVFNGSLPAGLVFDPLRGGIAGVVAPMAIPGRYYLKLIMLGDAAPAPLDLSITIAGTISETVDAINAVEWLTPAGSLGTLAEGQPCLFSIAARNAIRVPISYVTRTGSQLPPGLLLDLASGEIKGRVTATGGDATYTFTVRAVSGQTYSDRNFSITITNRYTSTEVLDFRLRLPQSVRGDIWSGYASNTTLMASLFRPTDGNFGLTVDPSIYLIGGIDGSAPIILEEYHRRLSLVLGGHKIALARHNGTGAVLYEVLYREVHDPQARAGGFSRTESQPVEEPVPYWQAAQTGIEHVYPHSLRNRRLDLIDDFGFATNDPVLRRRLGPTGVEAMPLWMVSQQVRGVASSVPGYVPAVVVAYLRPGRGAAVLAALASAAAAGSIDWRIGYDLSIDRYLVTTLRIATTTFDGNTTRFDTDSLYVETRFDTTASEQGKYFILNGNQGAP